MFYKVIVFFGLFVIHKLIAANNGNNHKFEAPFIEPAGDDITYEHNTSFNLTCESHVKITWIPPAHITDAIISHSYNNALERPYITTLTINGNTNANHVGEYLCVHNDSIFNDDLPELKNVFKASGIYVFIKDPNNLLAPVESSIITVVQYTDVIIPCKPTSKKVHVRLVKQEEESDVVQLSYDPRYGFVVRSNNIGDTGTYKCMVDHTDISFIFHLEVAPCSSYIPKPTIDSITNCHASEGDIFSLECKIQLPPGTIFTMNWTLPNDNIAIKEGRASFTTEKEDIVGHSIGKSILSVQNADSTKDNGRYNCHVFDYNNNNNSNHRSMIIVNSGESYIDLKDQSGKYTLNNTVNINSIQWSIRWKAFPMPTFMWLNNRGEQIVSDNVKYVISQTHSRILLEINNIELNDVGDYKLIAYNDLFSSELKMKLNVEEKPNDLNNKVSDNRNKPGDLECHCLGYPLKTLSWDFTPCSLKINCTSYHDEDTSINEIDSNILTQVKPNIEPEIVTCKCINEEETIEIENVEEVVVNKPLKVWVIPENVSSVEGDSFVIICTVLANNFTGEINWYRNSKLVKDTSLITLSDYSTMYSSQKMISFDHIKVRDAGTYECRAFYKNTEAQTLATQSIIVGVQSLDIELLRN